MSATTIRVERNTAELLKRLGHKSETYDQTIRRLVRADLIEELQEILDTAEGEDFIPADKVPWDKLDELDEADIDAL
ncbi:MAG: hypothetical protein U9M97_03930 [Candidatus Hadarchaeota archaeon]|nr:hypothetical protein [Candidatus Hadarchaeota archaeon]